MQAVAGPRTDWPEQGSISLEIDRAVSAGQEVHPLVVNFQYSPRILALEKLKFGYSGGISVEATGSLDRSDATGIFALRADAASLSQVTGIAASFAPALAERYALDGQAETLTQMATLLAALVHEAATLPSVSGG